MANNIERIARKASRWIPPGVLGMFRRPVSVFFHGVEAKVTDPRVERGHLDAEMFYATAQLLKKYFDVLPMSALAEVLRKPEKYPRALFLTSDDGLANNLTVAADILGSLDLPWTLFVSTHHVETGERLPTFLVRLFVYYAQPGTYQIPAFDVPVQLGSEEQRASTAETVVNAMKSLDAAQANATLNFMVQALGEHLQGLLDRFKANTFLTWDGVRELHRRGVEIGGHAHFHWPMHAGQSADYLHAQAVQSRKEIENKIGPCQYFAYPYGDETDVGVSAWKAVRDAGYDYAFSTVPGTLDAATNPYLLPRYFIRASDRHIASILPFASLGNANLVRWQRQLAA